MFTINYMGEDVEVVNEKSALLSLNEPDQVSQYIYSRQNDKENVAAQTFGENSGPEKLWSSRRSTQKDHDATAAFLMLRENYHKEFSDKKTSRPQLWRKIATNLGEMGFPIEGNKEGEDKCRQKFANLQKSYLKHVQHMNTTGTGKRPPPPFFEELHSILGDKHKTNPPMLVEEPQPGPSNIRERFSTKRERPKSTSEKILSIIKKDQEEKNERLGRIENLLEVQN